MLSNFNIINNARGKLPRVVFDEIKESILGKNYILTLVVTNSGKIKELNTKYRGKKSPTDILSFPLSKTEGEIYICPSEMRKEMKKFDRPYENFIVFLFIHGCTHLKGYDHGSTMEKLEEKIRRRFKI